ncbi:hypothetical protein BV22DRAFT_1051222 [Leucogyrophana mollusca]|uniref:Uncharacterized protein n=1 Tax=Leucogyrophana mollusca TaxID=85980 RepID=A0ACB8B074_9AGAM|nr:hypothetical protein BV22DRAFT_1051222 [Leucogyrophana mollusca]
MRRVAADADDKRSAGEVLDLSESGNEMSLPGHMRCAPWGGVQLEGYALWVGVWRMGRESPRGRHGWRSQMAGKNKKKSLASFRTTPDLIRKSKTMMSWWPGCFGVRLWVGGVVISEGLVHLVQQSRGDDLTECTSVQDTINLSSSSLRFCPPNEPILIASVRYKGRGVPPTSASLARPPTKLLWTIPSCERSQMSGDTESTEGKIEFSLTVVGATGLSPPDNHPTGFCVVVEVDGKQGRTAELAPSPQSTIEWNASFPLLTMSV